MLSIFQEKGVNQNLGEVFSLTLQREFKKALCGYMYEMPAGCGHHFLKDQNK